jgi:hypothetical protein
MPLFHSRPSSGQTAASQLALWQWLLCVCGLVACGVPNGVQAVDVQHTAGAGDIEANFPAQTAAAAAAQAAGAAAAGYPFRALSSLRGALVPESVALLERATAAFKASSRIDVEFDHEDVSSDATKAKFLEKGSHTETAHTEYPRPALRHGPCCRHSRDSFSADVFVPCTVLCFLSSGGLDFAVVTRGPSPGDYLTLPSLTYYPLHANAIVFTYNLPKTVTVNNVLSLRPSTLCRIFRGDITQWNDTDIQADNPNMKLGSAEAAEPIRFALPSVPRATYYWFSTYCGKIDPVFASLVPVSDLPSFPVANARFFSTIDIMNSAVSDTPFTIAVTIWSAARALQRPVGALLNSKGASGAASAPTSTVR